MADKTPIRLVFTSGTPTGIAEYQTGETIGIAFGGTGATSLTADSILTGNGTSAIQATSLQISGTSISTSDSTSIQINEALDVSGALTVGGSATITGNLTVQGTTTTVNSTTIDVQNSLRFEGSTSDDFETNLTVTDPTADRTITLPNATGEVILKDGSNNISQSIATLTATSFTDGSATMTSGSITGLTNVTGSGTANFTTDVQINSISVATKPFAIAQAVALG